MTWDEEDPGRSPSMNGSAQTAEPPSSTSSDAGSPPKERSVSADVSSAELADALEIVGAINLGSGASPSEVARIRARPVDMSTVQPLGSALPAASGSGASDLPTSSKPGSPSSDSRTRWSKPSNAAMLAAQANDVATRVLNGDIELEVAARYASTARVAVSAMNIEVQRARAARQTPNLLLDNPIDEEV